MRFPIRRPKWPFDAAVTIALLALTVSVAQFLFTTPFLNSFIVGPKLVARGQGSDPKADVLTGMFHVVNEGNSPATRIELGLVLQADQRVSVMPNIGATIVEPNDSALVKNVRIEVERLTAGESFIVVVLPGPSNQKLHSELAESFAKAGIKEVPAFSFLRSMEGLGTFNPQVAKGRRGVK